MERGWAHRRGLKEERKGMPDISQIQELFAENQFFFMIAAFILAFVGYALLKRLLKMALFLVVFLAIYAGLVYYLG